MRIHHVNCGTMCPPAARLIGGRGGWLDPGRLVCHCLLVETDRDGLIVVDTGLGAADIAARGRLPRAFRTLARPLLDPAETLVSRVRELGFDPRDVRHIAITHLDVDHAGGVADFPDATVHVHESEKRAALDTRSLRRARYVPEQFAAHQRWAEYADGEGDQWLGLAALMPLAGVSANVALVPLHGHSRGHCGVVVDAGDRVLLHAGDAYFSIRDLEGCGPVGLRAFQRLLAEDDALRRQNQRALAALRRDRGDEIGVFCAHDPDELARARERAAGFAPTPAGGPH